MPAVLGSKPTAIKNFKKPVLNESRITPVGQIAFIEDAESVGLVERDLDLGVAVGSWIDVDRQMPVIVNADDIGILAHWERAIDHRDFHFYSERLS